jgi:hypothetical protein
MTDRTSTACRTPTLCAMERQRPPCSRCYEERILTDDDLRALYAQPVTGTHPHAKPAHKPRDWSAE